MDEDLDYMSDEFIKSCINSGNDIRPGLLILRKVQRQHNLEKEKNLESKKKSIDLLQIEVLEESLKQPINATNKGFSMLKKMGFKSGMGLGKNNSGIKEPIRINLKHDKVGLGHEAANLRKLKKSPSKLDKVNENDFRTFMSKKNRERETLSDLRKSQRICKELDLKCYKSIPKESWFWPDEEPEDSELEKAENLLDKNTKDLELSDNEKLEMLTKYLRENFYYCVWCKVQYDDEKDLEDCPGLARDDH